MYWRRARFKDAEVWAEVDAAGRPVVSGGRRAIRYSDAAGAKVYRAGAAGLGGEAGPPVQLAEGTDADASRPASRGSGFGKAGTRTRAQAAAAEADARSRIEAAGDAIQCYTDGACTGNPGPAGSGCRVQFPDGRVVEEARALGRATNNVAELTAVEMALDALDEAGVAPDVPAVVWSDSGYARGVLTLGWKAKANVELITELRARLKRRPGVRLEWVAGHVGIPGNERADVLARNGVDRSKRGIVD